MAMKMTYSWILYSCLMFGSGILCDRKLERREAVRSCFVNTGDKFNCTNRVSIESSKVCDGRIDCPDGLDETNQLCGRNEYRGNRIMDCGRVYTNQSLINNSQEAVLGTAPWNVGLYRLNEKKSNYDLICGGSLISSNLVISVAHCFWEGEHESNKIILEDGQYKIAVGKYNKNIEIEDSSFTLIMDVDYIYLKEGFNRATSLYKDDIAIIKLKNRVSFSHIVAPVCIDWNSKYNESNGNRGKIVGWGRANNGIPSPILLEASLRYIDRISCQNMYTNGTNTFQSYVFSDKFCADSSLEKGMHMGYDGAGLSFFHNNSYYLTGVMSNENAKINYSIAAFTDVKYHIQWIGALYNRHRRRAGFSCSVNDKEMFRCSNGMSIKTSWICDGLKDCSDGSDETFQLCA